ncbi:MAG: ATP-binding protein [Myxococcota bacterium]
MSAFRIDDWIGPEMAEPGTEEHYRARVLVGFSMMVLVLLCVGMVAQGFLSQGPFMVFNGIRLLALLALMFAFRRGVSITFGTHALLGILYLGSAFVIIGSGAQVLFALVAPVMFLIIATALSGWRAGLVWAAIITTTMGIGMVMSHLFDEVPFSPPSNQLERFRTIGVWFLMAFAVLVSSIIDVLRQRNLAALIEAREQAAAAAAAREEFVARMSHEIRTPLNGVLGMGRLMQQTTLDAEQAQLMRGMMRAGDQLLRLLNDLLDISKLNAEQMAIERLPVDIAGLVEDVVALMEPAAQEHSLAIHIERHTAGPWWIISDPNRLQQIMLNLLSNAIKFTPSGRIIVHLSLHDDRLQLAVEDTGVGIDEERQARLFELFTQADASTARTHGGTGLGLAICRQLARLMGGDISIHSEVGVGSRFTLDIPVARTAPTPQRAEADDATVGLSGLRVLIADDHEINRLVLSKMLHTLGCVVTAAENGQQAVQYAQREPFDAILMDWHMPILDGLSATRTIRASLPAPPPIIALTANVTDEARRQCAEAGMTGFLTKPIHPADLHRALASTAS